ncbi:DUF4174 domain-containing protein [Rubellimicrobium arenae]|uniref:DUF4174 domain-containing protein n=1 Tax=Rubellimicrobium arenae TaxID=2817372 RepID=UPI001B312097|nr:DUF4174 domain-containing protein [Rubellimicrobium arenae]
MTRILALLLLAASPAPALAQAPVQAPAQAPAPGAAAPGTAAEPGPEAAPEANPKANPEPGPEAAPDAPPDAVALWRADPTGVLPAAQVELGAFLYLARPLVIFGDSPRQPQVAEQLRLLAADAPGLARRDVAVILDAEPAPPSPVRQALRPRGFEIVLLDKDGRVAIRRPAPLSAREIGRAIDRTPSRQDELRQPRHPTPPR